MNTEMTFNFNFNYNHVLKTCFNQTPDETRVVFGTRIIQNMCMCRVLQARHLLCFGHKANNTDACGCFVSIQSRINSASVSASGRNNTNTVASRSSPNLVEIFGVQSDVTEFIESVTSKNCLSQTSLPIDQVNNVQVTPASRSSSHV